MRRAKRLVFPFLFLVGIGIAAWVAAYHLGTLSAASPPSLEAICVMLAEQRELAHQAIEAGEVWDGAMLAVASLRGIPGADPYYINDALVEESADTVRFTVFIIQELMDDDMRRQFLDGTLLQEMYPTDELVDLTYTVASGLTLKETHPVTDRLWALTNTPNPVARLGALCNLASPYIFNKWPFRPQARQRLITEYAKLDAARASLRWSLQLAKRKRATAAEMMADCIAQELITPTEQRVLESDPVAKRLMESLPHLLTEDKRQPGLDLLCKGVMDEPSWRKRLACLDLAEAYDEVGETVRATCETLAASGLGTPDVVRAKSLALGYARGRDDLDAVRYWGEELMAIPRIRDQLDRPMHEGIRSNMEQYADFLIKHGLVEDGAKVYERLAEKYPNSALAERCNERAAEIREKGL